MDGRYISSVVCYYYCCCYMIMSANLWTQYQVIKVASSIQEHQATITWLSTFTERWWMKQWHSFSLCGGANRIFFFFLRQTIKIPVDHLSFMGIVYAFMWQKEEKNMKRKKERHKIESTILSVMFAVCFICVQLTCKSYWIY